MTLDSPANPPPTIPPWTQGHPQTVRRLNEMVRGINGLSVGVRPPHQVFTPPAAAGAVEIMSLVSVHADHLVCQRSDGSEVNVAKPPALQRTPFDGTGADEFGLSYVYQSDTVRTVTKAGSPFNGIEEIRKRYVVGGIIYASQPTGGTRVVVGSADVTWKDDNDDARAWAIRGFAV